MAELVNTFSWSFSAAEDFDECRRRRYWGKYAMWNGWREDASPLQRAAYRLGKMANRFSLLGDAVERAVVWALREGQAARAPTAERAYEAAAKPHLNECWKQSRDRLWEKEPKRFCCLREHYYGEITPEVQKAMVEFISRQALVCIGNFIASVLPRLAGVRPEDEVDIARVGRRGDVESFELEGVKVYAIPDYVYRREGALRIHDWKSGKRKETHGEQLGVYGLWANVKKGWAPEQVRVCIEYLAAGENDERTLAAADLDAVRARIGASVGEMAEYLEGGDIRRNRPLPKDEWDLAADRSACRLCNFYELCKPELDAE